MLFVGTNMEEENKQKNQQKVVQAEGPEAQPEGQETAKAAKPAMQSKGPKTLQMQPEGREVAKAEEPSTSQKPKGSIRVNSVEEVDKMTDQEVHFARLSGASRRRLQDLVKAGQDYLEAKRAVIKDNLTRYEKAQSQASTKKPKQAKQRPGEGNKAGREGSKEAQKRPRQEAVTPPSSQLRKKKARMDLSFKEALTVAKVAVAQVGFPAETMDSDRLKTVQKSIMEAYERIPLDGPQVRFAKCTHRPGYLVVMCADATSAAWLRETVPTLRPWEGASLKTLEGDEFPGQHACTVYVPDEEGQRLEAERILTRLRVGNKGLNTNLWTVFGKTPSDKGQVWTFSMDKQSMEELKNLQLCPYFGMGRIKFRPKEQGQKPEEMAAKDDDVQKPSSGARSPKGRQTATGIRRKKGGEKEKLPPPQEASLQDQSGLSPLKRPTAQKRTTPMEVEEAAGEDQPIAGPSNK